jgi:DNA-binding MarR family transcriptional regulator
MDKTALVATIDDLERRALVLRKPDPAGRRARIREITVAGEELLTKASEASRATERKLLAGMPDERIADPGVATGLAVRSAARILRSRRLVPVRSR